MNEARFISVEKKGWFEAVKVVVDTETGVQYIFASWGPAGGLTLLVDKDGKPLLDEEYAK